MFYLDSSALAKRYLSETGSAWVSALCDPETGATILIAEVTRVEVAAAIASRHRANSMTQADRDLLVGLLLHHCDTEYTLVPINHQVLGTAVQLTQRHRLRGYDAVQLAAALDANRAALAAELPAPTFISADDDLNAAARAEGLADDNPTLLERLLGLTLSVQTLEPQMRRSAVDVDAFYTQPVAELDPTTEETILVAQADGKGVPMIKDAAAQPVRLGKGQKRGTKKEAIVTALSTVTPYTRTADEVADAMLHTADPALVRPRPRPVGKEPHATLAGKAVACADLAQRAAQRDGAHIEHRVALTDGAEALQDQIRTQLPDYTLVRDIIHVNEYLWDAVNALLGETHTGRTAGIRPKLVLLLQGKTMDVITALEVEAANPT